MKQTWILGLVIASMATFALPGGAIVNPGAINPNGVNAVGFNFVPAVQTAHSGSSLHFQSLETAAHHQILSTPGNVFLGHLMPTGGWTCVPGSNGLTLGGSTCFDLAITQPAGSVILYHCQLHPFMNGAIVVV